MEALKVEFLDLEVVDVGDAHISATQARQREIVDSFQQRRRYVLCDSIEERLVKEECNSLVLLRHTVIRVDVIRLRLDWTHLLVRK